MIMKKPKGWNKLSVGVQIAACASMDQGIQDAITMLAMGGGRIRNDVPMMESFGSTQKVGDITVTVKVDMPNCERCGGQITGEVDAACHVKGFCADQTCPFSDHKQTCPAGWFGHPEKDTGPCNCKKVHKCPKCKQPQDTSRDVPRQQKVGPKHGNPPFAFDVDAALN